MQQLILIIYIIFISIKNRLPGCLGGCSRVVTIRGFLQYGLSEAINRQGIDLLAQLQKEGGTYYCISLDDGFSINRIYGQTILSINSKYLSNVINLIAPHIVITIHSCLVDVIKYKALFSGRRTILILTSNNPTIDIAKSDIKIKNIVHLNDSGTLKIICHSERAKTSLEKLGCQNIDLIPPFVNLDRFDGCLRKIDTINKIGFASSPLQKTDLKSKGCELLINEAKVLDDYSFKIIWRSKAIELPDDIPDNVQILYGIFDIKKFYNEVDSIIIPYTTSNNHSFPLTVIEAMKCGLPVIVSDVCGCAHFVRTCGSGIIFEPSSDHLSEALSTLNRTIEANKYHSDKIAEYIHWEMDESLYKYKQVVCHLEKSLPIIDLLTWHRSLQSQGKKLIVGKDEIEKYYKQENVVTKYDENRFATSSHKLISNLEQEFVYNNCKKQAERSLLLDLACGTGRFNNLYTLFDKVIMMDTSAEMLNYCRSALWFDSEKMECVNGDIFNIDNHKIYNAIICFRLIRHLQKYERKEIFQVLKNNLSDSGRLYFDVPLRESEMLIRNREGWYNYPIYDFFWDEDELLKELNTVGLEIDKMDYIEGKTLARKWEHLSKFQIICSAKKKYNEAG